MCNYKKSNWFKREDNLGRNFFQKFLRKITYNHILEQMELLIVKAEDFGLPKADVKNAQISLDYNEPEESFAVITEQMYEYNIKTDEQFYNLAMEICETLGIEKNKYQFLCELIKED